MFWRQICNHQLPTFCGDFAVEWIFARKNASERYLIIFINGLCRINALFGILNLPDIKGLDIFCCRGLFFQPQKSPVKCDGNICRIYRKEYQLQGALAIRRRRLACDEDRRIIRGNKLIIRGRWNYFHSPLRLNVAFNSLSGKTGRISDKHLTQKHADSHFIGINTLLTSLVFMNRIAQVQVEHTEKEVAKIVSRWLLPGSDLINEPAICPLARLEYLFSFGRLCFRIKIICRTLRFDPHAMHVVPIETPNPRLTSAIQMVVRKVFEVCTRQVVLFFIRRHFRNTNS